VSDERATVVELFAGAGGMALGLEQAGLQHVALVEIDVNCVNTLYRNGMKHVVHCDAGCIDYSVYGGVDVVAGGPPCQPFSVGGMSLGAADVRDGWSTVLRAVEEIQPKGFVFENVSGLTRTRFKSYLNAILGKLKQLGYSVKIDAVDAACFGIPQHRKRVFLTGVRGNTPIHTPRKCARVVTVREALLGLGPPNGQNGHTAQASLAREYRKHCASVLDKPSHTVVAGTRGQSGGRGVVKLDDGTLRYFTPREQARLQTFPDIYTLPTTPLHAVRQLGNACPPLLAKLFATELLRALPASARGNVL